MQLRFIIFFCILSYVSFNIVVGTNFRRKYDKLRKKVVEIFNKQKGSELLLNTNEFEYPRANETLRVIHKQLWQEYYECLRRTYSKIKAEKTLHPIALIALEGTLVTLKCKICISPIEIYTNDNLEWYFNNNSSMASSNETNKLIEESDNILISANDKMLMIYNIRSEHAGQYWCKLGDTLSTIYYLSIDNDSQDINVVYPETALYKPHRVLEKILPKYNLIIYTTWTKWSPCSTCNMVGKKNRYGYCTISLHTKIKKEILDTQIETMEQLNLDTISQEEDLSENVINKTKMALYVFQNQLPCKSEYLPKEILNITDIKNRKTELMIRYCKIKCSKNEIFEVRDKDGNLLESANNSAGIYSMVQGIPLPSPPVTCTIIFQKYKKKTALICPGNLNSNVPIIWKVGNNVLNPSIIENQSEGRIHINPQMHIIFKSLKFEDTNIYSCWQKNEIAGIIKLNVTGETELHINYGAIIIGGILIIITFLIIFWKVFEGRKRSTIH